MQSDERMEFQTPVRPPLLEGKQAQPIFEMMAKAKANQSRLQAYHALKASTA